jgi:hypothetical protein
MSEAALDPLARRASRTHEPDESFRFNWSIQCFWQSVQAQLYPSAVYRPGIPLARRLVSSESVNGMCSKIWLETVELKRCCGC